jgi:hypothetical protein
MLRLGDVELVSGRVLKSDSRRKPVRLRDCGEEDAAGPGTYTAESTQVLKEEALLVALNEG